MCGHRTRVCQLDCQYAVGACQGEPQDPCTPGTTSFVGGLSCDAGGRSRNCGAACTWGPYSECVVPSFGYPVKLGAPGVVVTALESMGNTPTLPRLSRSTCPTAVPNTQSKNAFSWVELQNTTSQTATVSVWFSLAPGGLDMDTAIAVYPGSVPPTTDATRSACAFGVNDGCSSGIATACRPGWGGLVVDDGDHPAITIPPNSSVMVFAGAINDTASALPHSGIFLFNARTEALQ